MDINKIKEAEPKEAILSGLVESGSLNVLIAPDCGTPGFFRSCVRAIALYMKNINGSLRAALFCDGEPDENDRKKTDLPKSIEDKAHQQEPYVPRSPVPAGADVIREYSCRKKKEEKGEG